jgi:uncharacterized protein YcbK (DUF882 family)
MRNLALSLVITVFFAGSAFAQNPAGAINPDGLRGFSNSPQAKKTATKPAAPAKSSTAKTTAAKPAATSATKVAATASKTQAHGYAKPGAMRITRYGAAPPRESYQPPPPPQDLDLDSPRSFSLVNVNTNEALTVTYWSDGAYHRDALDQLNHFLRDSKDGAQTEMDPLLFDVLWHTMHIVGFNGTVEVLSGYRSPTSNAWLASVSRGVANDSQHINGNAMDIRFPGVSVARMRMAAQSLGMGGVGFYPRSGFVHIDTGPIRYW